MGDSLVHHALRPSVCPHPVTRAVFIQSDRWLVSSEMDPLNSTKERLLRVAGERLSLADQSK